MEGMPCSVTPSARSGAPGAAATMRRRPATLPASCRAPSAVSGGDRATSSPCTCRAGDDQAGQPRMPAESEINLLMHTGEINQKIWGTRVA